MGKPMCFLTQMEQTLMLWVKSSHMDLRMLFCSMNQIKFPHFKGAKEKRHFPHPGQRQQSDHWWHCAENYWEQVCRMIRAQMLTWNIYGNMQQFLFCTIGCSLKPGTKRRKLKKWLFSRLWSVKMNLWKVRQLLRRINQTELIGFVVEQNHPWTH